MRQVALIVAATVALVAGCGGGGGGSTYSVDATAECLRGNELVSNVSTAADDVDVIAESAPGGAIRAEVGDKDIEVQIAFGRTSGDAETLQQSYEVFDVGVSSKGNAVIAWTFDPTDDERAAVEGCLA